MKNKKLISGVLIALSGCSGPMISYDAYQKQPLVFFYQTMQLTMKPYKKNAESRSVLFRIIQLIVI